MKHARIPALILLTAAFPFAACDKKPESAEQPTFQPFPAAETGLIPTEPREVVPAPPEATTPPEATATIQPTQQDQQTAAIAPAALGDNFPAEANRILQMPNGPERDNSLRNFVLGSMHENFTRIEEWIGKLPPSPTRDKAYAAFIEDLAKVAPNNALQYVSRISDPKIKGPLESQIQQSPRIMKRPEPPSGPAEPQPGQPAEK